MHRLYAEEGKGIFSARMNILGHMQQVNDTINKYFDVVNQNLC